MVGKVAWRLDKDFGSLDEDLPHHHWYIHFFETLDHHIKLIIGLKEFISPKAYRAFIFLFVDSDQVATGTDVIFDVFELVQRDLVCFPPFFDTDHILGNRPCGRLLAKANAAKKYRRQANQ